MTLVTVDRPVIQYTSAQLSTSWQENNAKSHGIVRDALEKEEGLCGVIIISLVDQRLEAAKGNSSASKARYESLKCNRV
jgi:hypothetical protein